MSTETTTETTAQTPEIPETDGGASSEAAPEAEESAQEATAGHESDSDDSADTDSDEGDSAGSDSEPSAAASGGSTSRVAQLEREGEIAADFLETLLDIADLDGDLEVDVEGDRAAVAIVDSQDGTVPKALVGQGATVLEALQELTRLAVQAETGERSRLMLDVGGYRAGRRTTLVELAQRVIGEVRESGQRRELDPMSAFERKIVHDQVLSAGLVSESEGEEPQRFVVILPS